MIAAAIAYTVYTDDARTICENLNSIRIVGRPIGASPGLSRGKFWSLCLSLVYAFLHRPAGLQPLHRHILTIVISRSELEAACQKIQTLTAFLWVGWIFATLIMAYTLYRAYKQSHLRSVSNALVVNLVQELTISSGLANSRTEATWHPRPPPLPPDLRQCSKGQLDHLRTLMSSLEPEPRL